MPGLTLTNFRPIGFEGAVAPALHIGADGKLVAAPEPGAETIDCKGSWLSPGWADLHVHVWHGGTDISVRADQGGLQRGVTAMADAGSAGEANFHGLREYVLDKQPETIRAFLNIGSIGLVACNRVSELIDMRSIDVDRTLAVIEANRDMICGVKIRASGVIVGGWGITPLKIGKRVAFHPPCTLQHGQQIRGKVEQLLRTAGVDVQLCADSHLCCGSAGTYSVLQPEMAYQLRDNKLANLQATKPDMIVSANIGCQTHLQSGTDMQVSHWIELIDTALASTR